MASLKDVKVGDEVVYVGLPFSAGNPPIYRIKKVGRVTAKRIVCMGSEYDRETGKLIGHGKGRISVDPEEMKRGYADVAKYREKREQERLRQQELESRQAYPSAIKLLGLIGDMTARELLETFDESSIMKAAAALEFGKNNPAS